MAKILNNNAYKLAQLEKVSPNHHKKSAGGYRDFRTNPIPMDVKKAIEVNRAPQAGPKINAPTVPQRNGNNPGLPHTVNDMEKGTTDSTRNIAIICGVLVLAGVIYYYYR